MSFDPQKRPRHLIYILGDQLNHSSAVWDKFDNKQDAVLMAEVTAEAEAVWNHKARIALFLSAMRHFRDELESKGRKVHYRQLDDSGNQGSLAEELKTAIRKFQPEKILMVPAGEWRLRQEIAKAAEEMDTEIELLPDAHFLCSESEFENHAEGRKQLRMEYFYREMRRKTGVLMDGDKPIGGDWNYDKENRKSFSKEGPGKIKAPRSFEIDETTQEVIALVEKRFAKHPGSLEGFDWPVNHKQAKLALRDFVNYRLATFGDYQDAMWTDQPYLYHSRISSSLNLKLIDPIEVLAAAEDAYHADNAPLAAVEGFIRQILGWREYVRGVYWLYMPDYLERNTLGADLPLPDFYWTGETEMRCLQQAIGQTLKYGYAHHIQRLMVTGLFALLLGVDPREVHKWYLAVYVDAVEWVELPNTLGMSQYADHGVMGSKPYCATGNYINRMSNYCQGCRFDPAVATGEDACPFTTLYWDFLSRNEKSLEGNNRMTMQLKNVQRKSKEELSEIQSAADKLKQELTKAN